MATGDVRNNIAKVQSELRQLQYTGPFETEKLANGDPSAVLPLIRFILVDADPALAVHFANHAVAAKSTDARFVDAVYLLLRDVFAYRPVLTKEQMLSRGFAERKLLLIVDIAKLCKQLRVSLTRQRTANFANFQPQNTVHSDSLSGAATPKLYTTAIPRPYFDATKYVSFQGSTGNVLDEMESISRTTTGHSQGNLDAATGNQFSLYQSNVVGAPQNVGTEWENEMGSGILDPDFSINSSGNVYGNGGSANISQSFLQEPNAQPPNPAAYPMSGPSRKEFNRRSILKNGGLVPKSSQPIFTDNSRDVTRDVGLQQPPLALTDLLNENHVREDVFQAVHEPKLGLLASTSATSGSRSLNHGAQSNLNAENGSVGMDAAATRIEAARNRWNSAGLVMPAGYKGSNSNNNSVIGAGRSGTGPDWSFGSRAITQVLTNMGVNDKESEPMFENGTVDQNESIRTQRLEHIIDELMSTMAKIIESQDSVKEDIAMLNERLSKLETVSEPGNGQLFPTAIHASPVAQLQTESGHQNAGANSPSIPDLLDHCHTERMSENQIEKTPFAGGNGAFSKSVKEFGKESSHTMNMGSQQRPTGEYIKNVEERLRETSELLRKVKLSRRTESIHDKNDQ